MYFIKTTFDIEFAELIMYLKGKYPKKLFNMDGIGDEQTDMSDFSKHFFSTKTTTADVSIDANANVDDMSVIAYTKELPKPFFRLNSYFVLWKKLRQLYGRAKANDIIEKQLVGSIYINDFHGIGAGLPYCYNFSTYDIALDGLSMVKKIVSKAPKYLFSFKSQLEQFVTVASNSTLGATGLADVLIVIAHYVDNILETKSDAGFHFANEEDCWVYLRENLVSFIYTINQPMRGNQSPFTNISVFDDNFLDQLIPEYKFDGVCPKRETVKKIQEVFLNIMNEEMRRTPVTFPIVTACFSVNDENEIQDEEFVKLISEKNLEFGFINIYCGKTSTLSSCCRLRSDINNEYFNSFGSGSSKIGSLGVSTINLPRIAFKNSKNEREFFEELRELVIDCQSINNAKRNIIQKRIENGNLPLYTLGFMNLKTQYSTVGINGFYEAVEIMGYDILTEEGQEFALKMINRINETNDVLQKQYQTPHNVEQIPAENVSVKLAEKDALLKYNDRYDFYSNQFIPLTVEANLLDRIMIQGKFDKHFSGGSIAHLNIEQKIKKPEQIEELIKSTAKQGVIYFAINYLLRRCKNDHMTVGNGSESCKVCGENIIATYTRVVGFLTDTRNWHQTRRENDLPKRIFYKEEL